MSISADKPDFLTLTTQIVAAYVANNAVQTDDVRVLIERAHRTLTGLTRDGETGSAIAHVSAASAKKSVFPDFIVCLEDGRKMKSMKRHLAACHGMTPQQYRDKWNLPKEYPMVAPNYAERRSILATQIGLGHSRKAASLPEPVPAASTRRRGRPAKLDTSNYRHAG